MPIMVRPKGVAKRIAYEILGVPANMQKKKATRKQRRIKRVLLEEETSLRVG